MPRLSSRRRLVELTAVTTAFLAALLIGGGAVAGPTATAVVPGQNRTLDTAAETLDIDAVPPAGAVYVATTGRDTGSGSKSDPLRTIRAGIARVSASGTVVVRGGTYREGSSDWISKNATLQAYPHEQVWMDGSDVVGGWTRSGDVWTKPWSTPSFCNNLYYSRPVLEQSGQGPCAHADMVAGRRVAADPQQAFVDGRALTQYATSAEAAAKDGFAYDSSRRQLVLGVNPAGHTVELSSRTTALALYRTTFTVNGIGFRRYASNEYTNVTSGAVVYNTTTGGAVLRSAFTQNAGGGLLTWQARGLQVRWSYLSGNGFNGWSADGSSNRGGRDDILVDYTRFDGNNTELYGDQCAASCAAAGVKMNHLVGASVRNSSFSDNRGAASGWWCDLSCTDVAVNGNLVADNGRNGIVYEVSQRGLIVGNDVRGNGNQTTRGAGLMISSDGAKIYHNTLTDNYNQALLYDDVRSNGVQGWVLPPDTRNVDFAGNLVVGGASNRPQIDVRAGGGGVVSNTVPSRFLTRSDYNAYFRPAGSARWYFYFEESVGNRELYQTPAELYRTRRVEQHSSHATSGQSARASLPLGPALPADVAKLLGTSAGSRLTVGAR